MKINTAFLTTSLALLLAACGDSVPAVSDPHKPTVDGVAMRQQDFLMKYCDGKTSNETCQQVRGAMARDSTKGTIPRF